MDFNETILDDLMYHEFGNDLAPTLPYWADVWDYADEIKSDFVDAALRCVIRRRTVGRLDTLNLKDLIFEVSEDPNVGDIVEMPLNRAIRLAIELGVDPDDDRLDTRCFDVLYAFRRVTLTVISGLLLGDPK